MRRPQRVPAPPGQAIIVPVAIREGTVGPTVYGWFYEPRPFRFEGIYRYIGYRPLGLFENGNQYGIWVAATALAAVALWQNKFASRTQGLLGLVAAMAVIIALMSQSAGAILLLLLGLAFLWKWGTFIVGWTLRIALLL